MTELCIAMRIALPTPKAQRPKSGRHAGEGRCTRRSETVAGLEDNVQNVAGPLEDTRCPQCGEEMKVSVEVVTTTDLPAEPARING